MQQQRSASFPKQERLRSRRLTERLFSGPGTSMTVFPLRTVFVELQPGEQTAPVAVLISVPKRRLKHAVDRNRLKRQIREAYRLNKHLLTEVVQQQGKQLALAFIALTNEPCSSHRVEGAVRRLLRRIGEKITVR